MKPIYAVLALLCLSVPAQGAEPADTSSDGLSVEQRCALAKQRFTVSSEKLVDLVRAGAASWEIEEYLRRSDVYVVEMEALDRAGICNFFDAEKKP